MINVNKNMKKVLSLLFSFLFVIFNFSIASFAKENDDTIVKLLKNQNVTWQSKGKKLIYLSDGISYDLGYFISEDLSENKEEENNYKYKKVLLAGCFYDEEKNNLNLDNYLEVKFRYDGKSAIVVDPEKDITHFPKVNQFKKLKVIEKTDIYTSPNQCIVSNQTNLNKKRKWYDLRKTWDNLDNFNIDIVCSNNGEIKINLESFSTPSTEDFYINSISSRSELLNHNITRTVNISDKIYKQKDAEPDKYEYKSRIIEIDYLNAENKLCLKLEIEANFRFNRATNEVECVSTSHRETSLDDDFEVYSIFLRSGDETKNKGGAYCVIELADNTSAISYDLEENISFKCDKIGKITSEITLNR